MTEFRVIGDYPWYRVGDDGSFWSRLARVSGGKNPHPGWVETEVWRKLTPITITDGSLVVQLFGKDGWNPAARRPRRRALHLLILEAFVGPAPSGLVCSFSNGNPADVRLANLAWKSRKESFAAAVRSGRYGPGRHRRRLSQDDIREIRRRLDAGEIQRIIADDYGVNKMTISKIKNRNESNA